ncbi:MAG TPA: serine hydrolase domain-containing protein [Steroidobacteraceae bacterium]|nr:serine hydrolase domain-containing protein [Steroidobacteraceae bacterium]
MKPLGYPRWVAVMVAGFLTGLLYNAVAWAHASLTPLEATEVHTFLQTIPADMSKSHIEGVAVIVVESGKIIAAEGFGRAQLGNDQIIDARTSMFRAGSLSKPVTAALVMQLVEEGRLNLDRDVSEYAGFVIPKQNGRALTMRDILTQSSGLSDTYRLIFSTDANHVATLANYARSRLPPFLYTPGTQPAYSNYAFGLAGYIVERLRAKPFADVARERIFEPLGMNASTFSQPPEQRIAATLVQGFRAGGAQPGPFEYVTPQSAGALSASAGDYATFVRALIGTDTAEGHRILRPATIAQMLTLQPGPEGAARSEVGMGLGVTIDRTRVGLTAVGHSGDTVQYHCEFRAYPERDLIIVAMQNTEGPPLIRSILRRFEERFGLTPPALHGQPDPHADGEVAGIYATGRYSAHSFLKFGRLLQLLPVQPVAGGGIRLGTAPEPLMRVGPDLYQDLTRTARRAVFIRDANHRVTGMRVEAYQTMLRTSFWERPAFVFGAIILGLAAAVLALLGQTVQMFRGRAFIASVIGMPRIAVASRAICSLALIVCIAGLYYAVVEMRSDLYSMNAGYDPLIRGFECAGWISAIAWLGFSLVLGKSWSRIGAAQRLLAASFAAATAAALVTLANYHVLTSTLNY